MRLSAPALLFPGHIDSSFVKAIKEQAGRGLFDGTEHTARYMYRCRHQCPNTHALLIFSRDTGHHTSGWWKNPDYERCYHLSISFEDGHSRKMAERWCKALFGDHVAKLWIEPPYSPAGKARDVWHYRLFCDAGWEPLVPRGEVYSKDWTPADWKSWSDLHGDDA